MQQYEKDSSMFIKTKPGTTREVARVLPLYNSLSRREKLDILEALGDWIDKELREL